MKRAMHSRASRAILAAALILSIGAAPIYANNILDQAVARAALAGRMAAVAQAQPCPADITGQAISNAETRGTGGALANGVLLPFAAIAMVRGTDIEPPASALVGLDREEVRCYTDAYAERLRERASASARTGSWIGVGWYAFLFVGLPRLLGSGDDFSY